MHRRTTHIHFYNHDSYWQRDALHTHMRSISDGLGRQLRHLLGFRDDTQGYIHDPENTEEPCQSVILVAHCYGGLVAKQVRELVIA